MPRKKSEATKRRETMRETFQKLDAAGQSFAISYARKLLELQEMEALVNRVKEVQASGAEACSFCGKVKEDTGFLMAGPGNVYICDDCVKLCTELIAQEKGVSAHDERG